jgi:hypothetical protein
MIAQVDAAIGAIVEEGLFCRDETRRSPSDFQRALDAGYGMTAEPDRAVLELDGHQTITPEATPLTGNI